MRRPSTPIGKRARLFAVATAAAAAVAGLTTSAHPQGIPPPPPGAAARPGLVGDVVVARPYLVQIVTPGGRYVTLHLHNGTVINPLGTTLQAGMHVSAFGAIQNDGSLYTDEVDLQPTGPFGLRRGPGRRGPRGGPPGGRPPRRP